MYGFRVREPRASEIDRVPRRMLLQLLVAQYMYAATPTSGLPRIQDAHSPGGPPAGLATTIARSANVVWDTPVWADDGTGAMPIGNGDATAMVWVDASSGDLRLVLGKSDAFDENSKPVKIGVLRLAFVPPLWKSAPPTPEPPRPSCGGASALDAFEQTNTSAVSTIGDQHHIVKTIKGWHGTAEAAAELCCNVSACVAFSFDSDWGLELFSTTATDVAGTPGGHWKTWLSTYSRKSVPLPPAWGAGAKCDAGSVFCQTLDIATSTVSILTRTITVNVSFDLNPPLLDGVLEQRGALLRVHAVGSGSKQIDKVAAVLEPYRIEQPEPFAGPAYQRHCYPRFEHPDVVDSSSVDALVWYHWNHLNTSYFVDTMRGQGVDPAGDPRLVDPFTRRAFGGRVSGRSLHVVNASDGLRMETTAPRKKVDVEIRLLTLEDTTPAEWTASISNLQPAVVGAVGSSPIDCDRNASVGFGGRAACTTTWEEITARNYIQIQNARVETTHRSERTAAENITTHATWCALTHFWSHDVS